ncbi:MAG TPA: amidophosphoribosyltransferase [Lutibacter sp.]|nr:amidophosphoribosyltransferase [Lutibacter sp.]
MSDPIKHECGIALVRLLKPLSYYKEKYGTAFWGLNKLYLLLEKQHNRGQDGAGMASIKFDTEPGTRYISRKRSNDSQPIQAVFSHINQRIDTLFHENPDKKNDVGWQKANMPYIGELFLGHVRYGTFGGNSIENVHPFIRQSNWKHRSLIMAGNFNMTNSKQLLNDLVKIGQHPKENTDTVTVMEKIGHFLDKEVEKLYQKYKKEAISKLEASALISKNIDVKGILQKSAKKWDGGYAMAGLFGHGDAFVLRDPNGIRPAFYYKDDEVIAVASERPALQTVFNASIEEIKELENGEAIIIKKEGKIAIEQVLKAKEKLACSFERIYFSRGNDVDIYKERKKLGQLIFPEILKSIANDITNTVFSYIPNTAETAFFGMREAAEDYLNEQKIKILLDGKRKLTAERVREVLAEKPRIEKIAIKDAKLRTFITDDSSRDDLVAHIYDITYGVIKPTDNFVIIDDSIVRGTTLKKSILRIVDRLNPKKIVVVSSAPQIRYPDCYGIDMAKLGDFIAFRAAVALLKETNSVPILLDAYEKCKLELKKKDSEMINAVTAIYKPFTATEISNKIGELLTSKSISSEVQIIYQSIENLHKAIPNHLGDWYFTGNYPTPGGNRVVNEAYINYFEGKNTRAY